MKSFWRALQFTRPYRGRFVLSLLSGLVVAVFWGGNISATYPLLTVLLDNKNLVDLVSERIAYESEQIANLQKEIARLGELVGPATTRHGGGVRGPLEVEDPTSRLQRRQSQLIARQRSLARYQWLHPYVERYTPAQSFHTLCFLMLWVLTGILVKSVFDFFQVYFAGSVVQLTIFDLRKLFYRKTMDLDLGYFSEKGSHELISRFTSDIESLSSGLRALLGKVMLEPLKALSCLAFACWFNWRLTLIAMLLFPLAAVIMGTIGRYLKRVSRRNLESMTRIYKILQESFLGIRVVKAFNMERYERRRFFSETKRYYFQAMKLIRTDALGGPILEFLSLAAVCSALMAGCYLVMSGDTHVLGIRITFDPIEPSMLLTFYGLIGGVCDPLRKVFSVYGRVQRGVAASERIFHYMDRTSRVVARPRAPHLARHARDIKIERVGFGYTAGRPVLRQIDLAVRFGETVAIVGPTGCGKTSLINLLPRFYDPWEGTIRIDGVDIRDVSPRSLRRQTGIVTQHTVLFDDTIFNNIAYGNHDVDPDEVRAAAQAAYAHRFIEQLPFGYETTIGEMGGSLSGGQRQRIALARAILRDPAILILDEATSSLDVESEALIHKALRSFTRGRTTFVVTHRLSTLDIADRIIVMSDGRIEGAGTHTELLSTSPTFRRLHEVQAKGA